MKRTFFFLSSAPKAHFPDLQQRTKYVFTADAFSHFSSQRGGRKENGDREGGEERSAGRTWQNLCEHKLLSLLRIEHSHFAASSMRHCSGIQCFPDAPQNLSMMALSGICQLSCCLAFWAPLPCIQNLFSTSMVAEGVIEHCFSTFQDLLRGSNCFTRLQPDLLCREWFPNTKEHMEEKFDADLFWWPH